MKKILCIVMAIFMLLCLPGCFDALEDDYSSSKYEFVGTTTMSVDYDSYFGYSVSIKGKLKNISKSEFNYVSVTFALYDEEGNQLDTALDSTNYLQVGDTWSFNADIIGWVDVEPVSFKVVEVNIW